jgi:LmbE family N-acetylglucosaminyl deacetylase
MASPLPDFRDVLVVCAHPDDESFGLGAVLHGLADGGSRVSVLCFTHGEASTLHGVDGDLAAIRADELDAASRRLGVERVELLHYPDGSLAAQAASELAGHVRRVAYETGARMLLVFDHGGITGHPDHQAATDAALEAAAALDAPVYAWVIPSSVADTLNREFGTGFVGRESDEAEIVLTVDRAAQTAAIDCHRSQATDNPVLRRRLELMTDQERLRRLS